MCVSDPVFLGLLLLSSSSVVVMLPERVPRCAECAELKGNLILSLTFDYQHWHTFLFILYNTGDSSRAKRKMKKGKPLFLCIRIS